MLRRVCFRLPNPLASARSLTIAFGRSSSKHAARADLSRRSLTACASSAVPLFKSIRVSGGTAKEQSQRASLTQHALTTIAAARALPRLQIPSSAVRALSSSSSVLMSHAAGTHIAEWTKDEINPDVIPCNPSSLLKVHYKADLKPGSVLGVPDTQHEPKIEWVASHAAGAAQPLYTVIMCDPDAPSRADPKYRCWLHWLVVNVPGAQQIGSGHTVAAYQGPAPPPKTGLHRYVFLVYAQKGSMDGAKQASFGDHNRGGWKIQEWLKEQAATLGDSPTPIAGNFFQAQNAKQ